jgi:hypothetical protein
MLEWLWWPTFGVSYFVVAICLAQFYGQLLRREIGDGVGNFEALSRQRDAGERVLESA